MVIHDLKHPTESMISQLETLETQLSDHAQKLQEVRLSLPEDLRNSQKLVFLAPTINPNNSQNKKRDFAPNIA
jgi:hypothetical protein